MKVAVVGATGLVGRVMLKVLEERKFPVTLLYPVASEKSVGKEVKFLEKNHKVISIPESIGYKPDVAIFSAGGQTSLQWAPEYAKVGTVVIDNSSAWRMDKTKKLVVPEINGHVLTSGDKIIANPNCSTIQMVMVLAPLHRTYRIKRVVVSTYQSVTGTGIRAVRQLENERAGISGEMAYPHQLDKNCLPHCDVFLENGYTKEEMKMVNETQKILEDNSIRVTATTVRVPVFYSHSESVNIETEKKITADEVREILSKAPGVVVVDNPKKNEYPLAIHATGKDETFVGRIREDDSIPNGINLWIVSDNIRKGAALNAVQIAEILIQKYL